MIKKSLPSESLCCKNTVDLYWRFKGPSDAPVTPFRGPAPLNEAGRTLAHSLRVEKTTIILVLSSTSGHRHPGQKRWTASHPTNVSFTFIPTKPEIYPLLPPPVIITISLLLPTPVPFCRPLHLSSWNPGLPHTSI